MPQPTRTYLSKSRFIGGRQCELKLWNDWYRPELESPVSPEVQARFDAGQEVGELARQAFPGVLVEADHLHHEEALAETARLLEDPAVQAIHEAAFRFQANYVRADLVVRRGGEWDLIEVKSVLHLKEVHQLDAGFQRWVMAGSGIAVGHTSLLHLNGDYRFDGGALDVSQLFKLDDISEKAAGLVPVIEADANRLHAMLKQPQAPTVEPGPHCLDPYECPYLAHCTRHWPKVSTPVDWLPRMSASETLALHAKGIHDMKALPLDSLSPKQLRALACHREDRAWLDDGLQAALAVFESPIHFLDFETYATAIPKLPGSRPYQPVPVQWSCHVLDAAGRLTHREFLAEGDTDPREAFADSLLKELGSKGSICVYSPYEKGILNALARALPHRAKELHLAISRLVDLLPIVQNHVYLPAFHGSYSIKTVLPALVPGFDYSALQVHDGMEAMHVFGRMRTEPDLALRQQFREDLLAYCAQDTLAMVKILDALTRLSSGNHPQRPGGPESSDLRGETL